MARFTITVDYDAEDVYVKKVKINGGYEMPSLEMTDLLTDVINDLEEKKSGSWDGYMKQVQNDVNNGK